MKLGCIIIDDEPLAIGLLESYVKQIPSLELVASFNNATEALDTVNTQNISLVFLDINMPNINGLDFSKMLPSSVKVVFTTAYDQYAIESFRLNALDYLLKPISFKDFSESVKRASDWFGLMEANQTTSIFIKSGYRVEKLDYSSIEYIENQKDYVKFFLDDTAEPISSLMSMQYLEEKLPHKQFMRVHRSFIVNLDKVQTVERNCIVFGKKFVPISDSYRERFSEFIDKHLI